MSNSRGRRRLLAALLGVAVGAGMGTLLGWKTSLEIGIVTGILLGLIVFLSAARDRGRSGWSDADGESNTDETSRMSSEPDGYAQGSPHRGSMPVGLGGIGSGLGGGSGAS